MLDIPVALLQVADGGRAMWLHDENGSTVLRILCSGRIILKDGCSNICAHADINVEGGIELYIPDSQISTNTTKAPTIEAVAIRDVDGKVWSMSRPARHLNVIAFMRNNGYEGPVNGIDQQGFVLSDGRFCRRAAARRIAEKAGQLKNGKTIAAMLTSEDLW